MPSTPPRAPGRDPAASLRAAVQALPASRIREVANAGLGRSDVRTFWFGESDEVTPAPVRAAAEASLQRGETFYSHNLGLPELRAAIAADLSRRRPADSGSARCYWACSRSPRALGFLPSSRTAIAPTARPNAISPAEERRRHD
jgi:hypothetical protein